MVTQAKEYAAVTTVDDLKILVDKLMADDKPIGFDLETGYYGPDFKKRSVDIYHAQQFVVGFSITNSQHWARYIPLAHDNGGNIDHPELVWEMLRPVLTQKHIVAHNAKFELANVRKMTGYQIGSDGGKITDTMLDAFLVAKYAHNNYRTVVGLKDLVEIAFDHKMMHIHELWPDLPANKFDTIRFNTLVVDPTVVAYACEDALWCLALLQEVSEPTQQQHPFMRQLDHQIMYIMEDVERYGVAVDWAAVETSYGEAQTFVPSMEQFVKQQLGELAERDLSDLNLNSAVQMKKLLFSEIGLVTTRMTKKGAEDDSLAPWQRMSSDAKSLVALAKDHEGIRCLLEYREVQNLNRRLKKWLTEYNLDADNRVHASYNQVQVASGRFAANEPAIQQLPKKWKWVIDPLGEQAGVDFWKGNFRDFIIASPGHYLLTYDYSQVELRMLAGASQEPALLDAFNNDSDVHTLTASMMLGKPEAEIDPDTERPIGKTFNFALMYGMGPKSLAEQLGIDFERAKALHAQYFVAFTRIASWFNKTRQLGIDRKFAETIFGRRIPVWELQSANKGIVAKGERVLINGPIQGSAADYMKIAMFRVAQELKKRGWWGTKCTIIMNQHDSLTFEVSNDLDPTEVRAVLQKCVVFGEETLPVLKGYPVIRADWELGQRWGSSTKWNDEVVPVFDGEHWNLQEMVRVDPEEIIFSVERNPTAQQFNSFMKELKENPGTTKVAFCADNGSTLSFPFTVSISERQEKNLANLVGATVTWK